MENSEAINLHNANDQLNNLTLEEPIRLEPEQVPFFHQCQHLLFVFPKKVWDKICSFLDSTSFQNLINSSPFFQELLGDKRVLFLYKPVFEILIQTLGKHNNDGRNVINLPFLLTNRFVCKTWKNTVDEMAKIWSPEEHDNVNLVHWLLSKNYHFNVLENMNKFIQKIDQSTHPSNVNPFIGKYISIQIRVGRDPNWVEFSNKISTVLEKYGHHLKTCEMELFYAYADHLEPHRNILKWLNFMPNLQTLQIQYIFQVESKNLPEGPKELVPSSQLKSLKKLNILTVPSSSSSQHIQDWSWMEHYGLSKLIRDQENLEYLRTRIYNKSEVDLLSDLQSPLKYLSAQYCCKQKDFNLFELCENYSKNFSKSLETLSIIYWGGLDFSGQTKIMQDSLYGRLNLPKVRKFDFTIVNSKIVTLDFLLGMQESLEELDVEFGGRFTGHYKLSNFCVLENSKVELIEKKQLIKFLGYHDKLLESNIWTLFPKLKKIGVTVSKSKVDFKRDDWVKNKSPIKCKN